MTESEIIVRGPQQEIERLQLELTETNQEKIRAAEYGLAVLEQKQQLESQIEEIEAQYESTKHELQCAIEALSWYKGRSVQIDNGGGIRIDPILQEAFSREEGFYSSIDQLESELKVCKTTRDGLAVENSSLKAILYDYQQKVEMLEDEGKQMKKALADYERRESKNLEDYSDVYEENRLLQNRVSKLTQDQKELEYLREERNRLKLETDDLRSRLDEALELRKTAETDLEEALVFLQKEREQKLETEAELDTLLKCKTAITSGLVYSDEQMHKPKTEEIQELEDDRRAENLSRPGPSEVKDILTEIHENEMKQLEQLLSESNLQKSELQEALAEAERMIECVKRDSADLTTEQNKPSAKASHSAPPGDQSSNTVLENQISTLKAKTKEKQRIENVKSVVPFEQNPKEVLSEFGFKFLANLRDKYEIEKAILTETIERLKTELQVLKEDAVMFSRRFEEYANRMNEYQEQLCISEKEKKGLKAQLMIVIQQKLELTQKLENMEVAKEQDTSKPGQRLPNVKRAVSALKRLTNIAT